MQCMQCNGAFLDADWVASISGSITGDEHTDTFFLCPACRVYTVASYRDDFTGMETMSPAGPVSGEAGDRRVALIRQCSTPWDKKCRCEAHCAYFRGTLD